MPSIELWTDGSCPVPDGPGGYAALLRAVKSDGSVVEREVVGGAECTTNNRMEMMALLAGLRVLKHSSVVVVYSDSKYLIRPFTEGWLRRWERNGWRTKANAPPPSEGLFETPESEKRAVKNRDLWEQLIEAAAPHALKFVHVKGHSGVELNERVDALAGKQTRLILDREERELDEGFDRAMASEA